MSPPNDLLDQDIDAALLAQEEGRALLVEGMLTLRELEQRVEIEIRERQEDGSPKAAVHPLRSAHAALIAARKELVMAEERAAARLRTLQSQHISR